MWYAKMFFSGDEEIFQYDAAGMQGVPSHRKEYPFLESLLSFQELNLTRVIPLLQSITEDWGRYIKEGDKDAFVNAMIHLGELGYIHIYFQVLYVHCYARNADMYALDNRGSLEDEQMLEEFRQLPELLPQYQKQIQRFFELVLDVDSAGRIPQAQASKNYIFDMPRDDGLFQFRPISLSFEPVEQGRCSPVLYSSSVRDMIDYSLRSCVERNITVRRCKNCGRYFAQTGRVSAEYCGRPVPKGQQRCRDIGALKQWTLRQADNEAFSAYRREYKKRFAWIKAGKIVSDDFYRWGKQAREKKEEYERGDITLDEFSEWLRNS